MSTNIEKSIKVQGLLPNRILLAESDPLEMARIRLNIDLEFRNRIKVVKNYNELLLNMVKESPQLLILGRIDQLNYFQVCQECHKIHKDLPIVLLSRQEVINDSFYQVVKGYGVTDIISNDFVKLNQLLQALNLHEQSITGGTSGAIDILPPEPVATGKMLLAGLEEIIAASNNYFGALAQGNYWRKAHAQAANEFPSIQLWSADHFGKLNCDASILEKSLTEEELQALRIWVQFFIGECERIIVDYGTLLNNLTLSPTAKNLLNKPS
jgi:DNA-binding NarL/FixJ family response regulator